MGLKKKTISHLTMCNALIKNNMESSEQFWIRELVWKYKKLVDQGEQIMVSNLAIRPFNLSKDDLLRINNYLDEDDGIQRAIKSLIKNTYFY